MVCKLTGNCLRKVSYSAWGKRYAYRQETVCERFPTRHGERGMHTDRKLLAKGFLLGAGERNTLSFLTGGTKTLPAFLPAPPVILSRRRRISVPVVNDSAAGHARAWHSPSRPLVLTAFTLTYHAYRDPSLALRMTCARREVFIFDAARRPVISSGAAWRYGGSGIVTIDTESRNLLLHCSVYHLRSEISGLRCRPSK